MYCSGCGQALTPGQASCPSCGRSVAPMPPVAPVSIPGFQFQLDSYGNKVKVLGVLWFIYGGLTLLIGIAALTFARAFFLGGMGHWMHGPGPMPPMVWLAPLWLRFAGVFIAGWAALSAVAGWGLIQHAQWGRVLAIVVAILNILKFPFGTALGIFTLVILLGYQNTRLYEHL